MKEELLDVLSALSKTSREEFLRTSILLHPETFNATDGKTTCFEHLASASDVTIQEVLRKVATEDLVVALKGGSQDVSARFFRNVSKEAFDTLCKEFQKPYVLVADELQVRVCRSKVLKAARRTGA